MIVEVERVVVSAELEDPLPCRRRRPDERDEVDPAVVHGARAEGAEKVVGHADAVERAIARSRERRLRDGELVLNAAEDVHIIAAGAPNNSRSAVLYGVFNEENTHVQWRLRHQFPGIRNEHAQDLGLRRELNVDDVRYGTLEGARDIFLANSYGYGLSPTCPDAFAAHDNSELQTDERAVFDENQLPIESSTAAHACAAATGVKRKSPMRGWRIFWLMPRRRVSVLSARPRSA